MEKEPIMLINGEVSSQDYIKGAIPALRNIPIMVIAILIGLLCLISSLMEIIASGLNVLPILSIIIAAMLIGFTPLLPKYQAKGLYKQLCSTTGVEVGEPIYMRAMLYDDKLIFLTDENAMTVEYTNIKHIYETDTTMALLTKDRILMIFPKAGCTGGTTEDAISLFKREH